MAFPYQTPPDASAFDLDDVNSFLENHQATARKRPGQITNGSNWSQMPSQVPRNAESSVGFKTRMTRRQSIPRAARTSQTRSSTSSSIFDTARSSSSASEVFDPVEELDPIYECEYEGYTGCTEQYWLGEEQLWFEHIAIDHMHQQYPRKSTCWYCDQSFKPNEDSFRGREEAFQRRMTHIAFHICNGTQVGRRPDHHLTKHLAKNRLIPDHVGEASKAYHEASQAHDLDMSKPSPYARGGGRPKGPSHQQPPAYTVGGRGGEREHHFFD